MNFAGVVTPHPDAVSHQCGNSNCQRTAVIRCEDCIGAPGHDADRGEATYYCCFRCQVADIPNHVDRCLHMRARKRLLRAAELLSAIYVTFRRIAPPFHWATAKRTGDVIEVDDVVWHSNGIMPALLDDVQVDNPDTFHTVMCAWGCTVAMIYLDKWVEELLGDYCEIKEVNVEIRPTMDIWLKPRNPTRPLLKLSQGTRFHNIYQVTQPNGHQWAFDPTGAQFGNMDLMLPYNEYCRRWVSRIMHVGELGSVRKGFQASFRACLTTPRQTFALPMERSATELEPFIAQWRRFSGVGLRGSLLLEDRQFIAHRRAFLHAMKHAVRKVIENAYKWVQRIGPEEMRRVGLEEEG